MAMPEPSPPISPRAWLIAALILAAVFAGLAWFASAHPANALDLRTLHTVAAHRPAALTSAMRTLTWLGSGVVLYPALVVASLALWRRTRRHQDPAALIAALIGAIVLYSLLKAGIGRARPPAAYAVDTYSGLAFPSGHATQSTAFYGMLALLTATAWPRRARPIWIGAVAVVLVVGASRVYLGAHWLTDVLGGFAVGAAWMCLVAVVWTRSLRRSGDRRAAGSGHAKAGGASVN